jgi:prepilin-type N-terminal cleavage/methylation domain-containing protein/prepilin-type processing-associated H-X9-DG protein
LTHFLLDVYNEKDFMNVVKENGSSAHLQRRAFTLMELLVVMAVIAILAALLLPALARARQKGQGIACLNNGRQLMMAVLLYTPDNHEFYPPNPDGGNVNPGYNWCAGQAGIGGADEFNPDLIKNPATSLLINYLAGKIAVFKCPADARMGAYDGTDNPVTIGQVVPAARTFSMNNAVGTIDPLFAEDGPGPGAPDGGVPTLPVNGPWLNNLDTNKHNSPWRTFGKSTDPGPPNPSMLWVLVDEDVKSLNDAAFCFGMVQLGTVDVPGSAHAGACGFAFADGHSEIHHWRRTPVQNEVMDAVATQDWTWMQQRTSSLVGVDAEVAVDPKN